MQVFPKLVFKLSLQILIAKKYKVICEQYENKKSWKLLWNVKNLDTFTASNWHGSVIERNQIYVFQLLCINRKHIFCNLKITQPCK